MKTITLFFTCLLANSCIVINKHAEGDGSATADMNQVVKLSDPEWTALSACNTRSILEINAEKLKHLIEKKPKTLMVFSATWCGHCQLELPSLLKAAQSRDIIFVWVDYNVTKINRALDKNEYGKPVYILASSQYGADEAHKANVFLRELTAAKDTAASFPRHLVFRKGVYAESINEPMTATKIAETFEE